MNLSNIFPRKSIMLIATEDFIPNIHWDETSQDMNGDLVKKGTILDSTFDCLEIYLDFDGDGTLEIPKDKVEEVYVDENGDLYSIVITPLNLNTESLDREDKVIWQG